MGEWREVPDDIKQTATRIAGEYLVAPISCDQLYRSIADALMDERERCARIAEMHDHRGDIATALRREP